MTAASVTGDGRYGERQLGGHVTKEDHHTYTPRGLYDHGSAFSSSYFRSLSTTTLEESELLLQTPQSNAGLLKTLCTARLSRSHPTEALFLRPHEQRLVSRTLNFASRSARTTFSVPACFSTSDVVFCAITELSLPSSCLLTRLDVASQAFPAHFQQRVRASRPLVIFTSQCSHVMSVPWSSAFPNLDAALTMSFWASKQCSGNLPAL